MPPTDIDLPKYSQATVAALHRDGDDWSLSFNGDPGFTADGHQISQSDLAAAGIDGSQDRLVVGYVESRLLAAGYGFEAGDGSPTDVVEAWTLH
jgi:hypothetical protein